MPLTLVVLAQPVAHGGKAAAGDGTGREDINIVPLAALEQALDARKPKDVLGLVIHLNRQFEITITHGTVPLF